MKRPRRKPHERTVPSDEAAFWALAEREPRTGCRLWRGRASPDTKGHLLTRVTWGGRQWLAHRLAWHLSGHALPPGQKLLLCPRSRLCVNPAHLQLSRGTPKAHLQGERASGVKLTAEQVRRLRRDYARGLFTYAEAAQRLGLTGSGVASIVQRRSWKHLPD